LLVSCTILSLTVSSVSEDAQSPRFDPFPIHSYVVLAMVPTHLNGSGLGLEPELNRCNGSYPTKTQTVAIGPVLPPKFRHFKSRILAPIKYLSSDCIVT